MTEQENRDDEIHRVAVAAARAAAEIVSTAAVAASHVAATAANAATALADSTRVELRNIKEDLQEIKLRLDNKFVSIEAFDPVRKLVHGMVALILIAVVGAILALVIRQ